MQLKVEREIFERFPEVLIALLFCRGINNTGEHPEVTTELRKQEAQIRETFANKSPSDHPYIASWRDAYRKFGAKPKDYPSSVENLVRRVARGYTLPHINSLVDIYNAISLRFILPLGGEDLDAIRGDIVLAFAGEHEVPVQLLGEKEQRPPHAGEVIYKDDAGAICRRWNWKEAERTKLSESTRNAILVIEAMPPVNRALAMEALQELETRVGRFCGGELQTVILDPLNPTVILNT